MHPLDVPCSHGDSVLAIKGASGPRTHKVTGIYCHVPALHRASHLEELFLHLISSNPALHGPLTSIPSPQEQLQLQPTYKCHVGKIL